VRTVAVRTAIGIAAAAVLCATRARALGPVDLEIAGRAGVAASAPDPDLDTNPYGFGLGGRAGVSFVGIYAGVSGIYYLGTSSAADRIHTAMEGAELGYTFGTPVFKVRPLVGFGNSTTTYAPLQGSGSSFDNLYVEPRVLLMVPLGTYFVGVDAAVILLPGGQLAGSDGVLRTAFGGHLELGMKF
jgi:hypothetical protein